MTTLSDVYDARISDTIRRLVHERDAAQRQVELLKHVVQTALTDIEEGRVWLAANLLRSTGADTH